MPEILKAIPRKQKDANGSELRDLIIEGSKNISSEKMHLGSVT